MSPRFLRIYERSPILVQNILVSLYGYRLLWERMDRDFEERLAWLRVAERWSLAEQRAWQEERLREIVSHAFEHIPFYRARMKERKLAPGDLRTLEDLPKLPVLRREEVHDHLDEMLSPVANRRELVLGHTSGTTGSPLEFWWDRRVCVWNNLMLHRFRGWAGYRFGDPTATLLGNVIVPLRQQAPPFWRTCLPWNKIFFSSFHLEPRHLPAYVAKLRDLGRVWIEAYPSTAYVLARHLEETGTTLPVRGIFLSSETLTAQERETIDRSFETVAWDTYSMSERVIVAGECERHDGQHLFPEYGITEVLDERDQPVSAGRPGRLVATGLQNLAMPLLRYDTGDVSGIDPEPCGCGRTLPRLLPITTKAEDIVVTPSGRFVSSSVLTHPFKPMRNIERSQIVQDAPDHVTVRVVRRPEYCDRDSEQLLDGLRQRLGDDVRIEIELVDSIPRSASGKYRWVVSRVPLRFGEQSGENLFPADDGAAKGQET